MKNILKNKKGGFLQLIILLVLAIFFMSYFHITIRDAWNWFITALHNIF